MFLCICQWLTQGGMGWFGPPTFLKYGPRDLHKNFHELGGGGGVRKLFSSARRCYVYEKYCDWNTTVYDNVHKVWNNAPFTIANTN